MTLWPPNLRSAWHSVPPARRNSWWRWIAIAAIGAAVFYAAAVVFPRIALLWGYSGIKSLLYEDLGVSSDAWASFLALIGSFIYAVIWAPMLFWTSRVVFGRFGLRKTLIAFALWLTVYGHVPLLRALVGSEVCFNQRTGEPLKWFVIQPGGHIVLFDSPGYDQNGAQKRPATSQICRIIQAQQRGVRPSQITTDPRDVKFFDGVSGFALVWYYKASDGHIDLFDAEGVHPVYGEPLLPVTKEVVEQVRSHATAKAVEAERAAQAQAEQIKQHEAELQREREEAAKRAAIADKEASDRARVAAERAEADAREKARLDLVKLFGVDSYPPGIIIIGSAPRSKDEASTMASRSVLDRLTTALRQKGMKVDQFRPRVYSSGYYDPFLNGDLSTLAAVGLRSKMRASLITAVDAKCRQGSIAEIVSCTIFVEARVATPLTITSPRQWSEVGPGNNMSQALDRAAELMIDRHPDLLEGL